MCLLDLILENAFVVLNPFTVSSRNQTEKVHRIILSFAANMLKISSRLHFYEPVLLKLKLQSLDRHGSANKIFILKFINDIINCPELLSCINFIISYFQSLFLYPFSHALPCTTNYFYNQPIYRIMRIDDVDPIFLY